MLRRLAIFMGRFDLDGAIGVAGLGADAQALTALANLVRKSLVVAERNGEATHYRLLNTTRIYALERLAEAGEREPSQRRHADYLRDVFARARDEWETEPTQSWLTAYGHRLADLGATLDWAFSPRGDPALGVALTADAVPLWLQLSLMRECRQRAETAMAHCGGATPDGARTRMRLSTARSLSRMYMLDPASEVDAGWRETLALAEQVGDPDYQRRAIWGLFAGAFNRGCYRDALGLARRFTGLTDRADDRLIGERLIGTALHLLGEQVEARRHIERMLAGYTRPPHSSHIIRYQNDQIVAARRVLAPILWLVGCPEQAMQMVEQTVAEAIALAQPITLCNLLAQAACPVALLSGDPDRANRFITLLLEQSDRHALDIWHAYGQCYDAIVRIRRGDLQYGVPRLRSATETLRQAGFTHNCTFELGALAEGEARAGSTAAGLQDIDAALSLVESTEERWCLAELLRIKGELLLLHGAPDASASAERLFRELLSLAEGQHGLAWQLRSATSLGRLLRGHGREGEAREVLQPIYARFTEGFETEDLKAARQLLDALAEPGAGAARRGRRRRPETPS